MAQTKAISGNSIQNTRGTILGGGSSANEKMATLLNNLHTVQGNHVQKAVSPTDSGNLGTVSPITGSFGQQTNGYIGPFLTSYVAGVANTTLRIPGSNSRHRSVHPARGNYRYDITSWDYVTGAATKGGSAGQAFTYWGPASNGSVAVEDLSVGEFTFIEGPVTPSMKDYGSRNLYL